MLINANSAHIPVASNSVHCVTTSPPYKNLRVYHDQIPQFWPAGVYSPMPGITAIEVPMWVGNLGNEPSTDLYVWHLVLIFKEVFRILRPDGVVWLNLGDSFMGSGGAGGDYDEGGIRAGQPRFRGSRDDEEENLDDGDIIFVPHRVALALQADGWYVRNDTIWHKRSAMPNSPNGWRWERHKVKIHGRDWEIYERALSEEMQRTGGDRVLASANVRHLPEYDNWEVWDRQDCPGCKRCESNEGMYLAKGRWRHTRAHEYVFQLTKGEKYWSDKYAVMTKLVRSTVERSNYEWVSGDSKSSGYEEQNGLNRAGKFPLPKSGGANPRTVFAPHRANYSGKHYAVFPPDLISPFIQATCPPKCCSVCGTGWSRVVDESEINPQNRGAKAQETYGKPQPEIMYDVSFTTLGWKPSCAHAAENPIPGIVFDPFSGSGTTGLVARELQRRFIGLDVSYKYLSEQATVRAERKTNPDSITELPLFAGLTK